MIFDGRWSAVVAMRRRLISVHSAMDWHRFTGQSWCGGSTDRRAGLDHDSKRREDNDTAGLFAIDATIRIRLQLAAELCEVATDIIAQTVCLRAEPAHTCDDDVPITNPTLEDSADERR